jgi:hypothetical protein
MGLLSPLTVMHPMVIVSTLDTLQVLTLLAWVAELLGGPAQAPKVVALLSTKAEYMAAVESGK